MIDVSVASAIRMAMVKKGLNQASYAKACGITTASINNKFYRDTWTADDLLKVAETTGGKLAFVYPDGQQILILPDEAEKPEGE